MLLLWTAHIWLHQIVFNPTGAVPSHRCDGGATQCTHVELQSLFKSISLLHALCCADQLTSWHLAAWHPVVGFKHDYATTRSLPSCNSRSTPSVMHLWTVPLLFIPPHLRPHLLIAWALHGNTLRYPGQGGDTPFPSGGMRRRLVL